VICCLRLATLTEREREKVDVEALLASINQVRNSDNIRFDAELHARALSEGRP
jgi:hypothetical protein